MKIPLHAGVVDVITKFSGIVVARCEYLNGCIQYEVQPEGLHEGKPLETRWFDEQRLVFDPSAPLLSLPEYEKPPGGPGDHPPVFSRPGVNR